jgi:Reverse transcriptase (RNA-dependent DNA polymerase)
VAARRSTGSEWVEALDFRRALRNCHLDFLGDWYRDPWGWCELEWAVQNALEEVVLPRLRGSGIKHAARLDVAKENFAVRPAVVMDPIDRLCYQALVDALSLKLIGELSPAVHGWRLSYRRPTKGNFAKQGGEWERYRRHFKLLASLYPAALKTDIVSCFSSIPVDRLAEDILDHGKSAISQRLVDMLLGFDAIHGRSGLPQRSAASAALANFYLAPLDGVLAKHARGKKPNSWVTRYGRALRWMDDIWVFGQSAGPLRKAQVELQEAMRDLGLDMNIAKTDVLEGDEVVEEAIRVEHSAVDQGLEATPLDSTELGRLVDTLFMKPEQADRTSIRFATHRMRKHGVYDRVDEFVDNAERMPQGSDYLARLFRDSETWRDMQDWYVAYRSTSWACIDWSTAQLGTMFPSTDPGTGVVRDHLAEHVDDSSLAIVGLAAQRLASWDPDTARAAIRDASKSADNPAVRRVLGLAALSAREERAVVRKMLGEFEETQVTLRMLEATNFRRPQVKADFQGG